MAFRPSYTETHRLSYRKKAISPSTEACPPMVRHRQQCHQATGERQIAVAPLCILTVRLMCGFLLERMPRIVAGCDVTDPHNCVFAIDCFGLSEEDLRQQSPGVFQHLFDRVKLSAIRTTGFLTRNWRPFAEPGPRFRESIAGLNRFIVTSENLKASDLSAP
jgi:hypothetical protein